jgi:membrane associated rhomboid family serine protease
MIPLRDTIRSARTPVVTVALIVVNVLLFLFEVSLDPFSRNYFIAGFGLTPDYWSGAPLTLLTYMFLHGGWLHLIGNCWFLWIYGDNVEDILGHWRYLLFYVGCGAAAGLVQIWSAPDSRIPTVGASGAIAGVMGAYLLKFPHARILTLVPIIVFFTTIEVPAYFMLLYWFLIQIVSGVGSIGYSQVSGDKVAWFAHVGGFLAGAALIRLLPTRRPFTSRADLHW